MKKQGTRIATLVVGLFLLGASPALPLSLAAQPAAAGAVDTLFKQTGYTVPAVFMDYWQSHGGLAIFGYPISPAQMEGGVQVQYFERNRFEYHPEHAGTQYAVQLGLLGTALTRDRQFPAVDPVPDSPTLKYFVQTGHILSGLFYRYWQAHGGLALFGYPISEQLQEGGRAVQYFERNRFEDHSEFAGTAYEVELGLLGRDYLTIAAGGQIAAGTANVDSAAVPAGTAPPPGAGAASAPATGPQVATGVSGVASAGISTVTIQGIAPGANPYPPGWVPTSNPAHPAPPTITGPTEYPISGTFLQGPHIGYGMIVHMYYQDHARILAAVKDIGFTWIKQQVQWSDTENPKGTFYWGELDRIVADTNAAGINLMLSVVRTPGWATASGSGLPDHPQDLEDFMQAISSRYAGRVKAYEIWNEENLGNETGAAHWHPEVFAEVLKAGFLGTRAGDPQAVVISGALTPTGVYNDAAIEDTYFLDQLYQWHDGELRNYYDVLGTHPYGFWNPPDTMWPVRQPSDKTPATEYVHHGSFYFRRIEDQRAVMVKHGEEQKQIWVTEFGWCSDKRDGGYVECLNNSLDDQANYIVRAFQKAQTDYPFMGVMFLWNLNFSTFQEWYTGPAHFSILNPDWSPRAAYFALKNMAKP